MHSACDNFPGSTREPRPARRAGSRSRCHAAGVDDDILANKEALQLIRAYYAMPEAQRRQIFELARVLSHAA